MAPAASGECVRVVVRCRPLNAKERAEGRETIVDVDAKQGTVALRAAAGAAAGGDAPKAFTFDAAFDPSATQRDVYENAAAGIVNSVLSGYNGTIFAYGQTGTGKTHTMEGVPGDPELQGIIPGAFDHVFGAIEGSAGHQYLVRASFLEIYNEEVRDLLSATPKERLELKEHRDSGVYAKGLSAFVVKSAAEMRNVLEARARGARMLGARAAGGRGAGAAGRPGRGRGRRRRQGTPAGGAQRVEMGTRRRDEPGMAGRPTSGSRGGATYAPAPRRHPPNKLSRPVPARPQRWASATAASARRS
jgi:hypothetical protein